MRAVISLTLFLFSYSLYAPILGRPANREMTTDLDSFTKISLLLILEVHRDLPIRIVTITLIQGSSSEERPARSSRIRRQRNDGSVSPSLSDVKKARCYFNPVSC